MEIKPDDNEVVQESTPETENRKTVKVVNTYNGPGALEHSNDAADREVEGGDLFERRPTVVADRYSIKLHEEKRDSTRVPVESDIK